MGLVLSACQSNEKTAEEASAGAPDLQGTLPGTWEIIAIRVNVNGFLDTDSTFLFEVREENWEETFGFKPKKTVFSLDNRYRAEFRDRSGNLVNESRGVWNVFGDTLMMIEPEATYQYQVAFRKGLADFTAMVDWDGDGKEDDNYLETHRYIGQGTE